jgi:mRNA interferase RelE/StbE
MPYQVKLLPGIEKQLRKIPHTEGERVVEAMRSLRSHPRHKAGDPGPDGCVHLEDKLYRIRVGRYRILYAVFDDRVVVLVCAVARRTEATYRDLRALMSRARKALGE